MERIERIHFFIDTLKPEAQVGRLTPEQKDEAINLYIMEMFNSDIEKYQEDRVMTARLTPFEEREVLTTAITDQNEIYDLPEGIQRIVGFGGLIPYLGVAYSQEVEMKEMPEMQFNRVYQSGLIGPETSYPICVIRGNTISVAPKNATVRPVIYYLRAPNPVRFGYQYSPNLLSQYYAKTGGVNGDSVDPETPSSMDFSILRGALGYLGISLRDEVLMATMGEFNKK